MDMTSVWVVEHGCVYLGAPTDCCTREITGWAMDGRRREVEALPVLDTAVASAVSTPRR
jgi:transposase InsO family protein